VVELAQAGVLEQLARGFPLTVTQGDVNSLREQLVTAEDDERMRGMLLELTKTVSEKLASSIWKTVLPKRSTQNTERAKILPTHLRCLVETLPEEEEVGKILFWIEDRTLSQQPISGSYILAEIIAHLSRKNRLSKDRISKLHGELRQWGYLFMPIDVEDLASIIESSPVVDAELVENARLSEVRRWFARDVKHLIYLDQKSDIDAQGRIVGEVRRTFDLSGLSRDLLASIWRSKSGTDADRAARSNWIWRNLRVTHLPPPIGADTTEALRSIASLAAVQALTLPIQAELNSARLTAGASKAYMEWVLSSAISPMIEADPAVLVTVSDMASAMLARIIEREGATDTEVDADEIAKAFQMVVRRFLSLLPGEWYDRLTNDSTLKKTLQIERVMLISLDDKLQVSVRVLEEAIDFCLQHGKSHTDVRFNDGSTTARLELAVDDGNLPTALLKVGKRAVPLHASTLALVHPDRSVRERLISGFVGEGSVGDPFTAEYLTTLANEGDVEKRVDDFHQRLASDFARRKQQMAESLSISGTIQVTDLDLPPVGDMLNYLGLPADFRGSALELVEASVEALRSSVGIERAMSRISSLPIDIPADAVAEFGKVISDKADTWPREESVLAAGFWLLSQTAPDQVPSHESEAWLTRAVTKDRAKLLSTFIRHSARQALDSDEWRELSPDLALCLIWVHADQLAREFASSAIDLPQFTGWLAERSRSNLFDFHRDKVWERWALEISLNLTAPLLIAKLVGRLISGGASIPDHLKSLLGKTPTVRWMPHPDVLVPTPSNPPGEFWAAQDPMLPMIAEGWLGDDHPFAERNQENLLPRIFEETEVVDPTFFASLISALIDIESVQATELPSIRNVLDAALDAPGAKADPAYAMITDLVARVYGRLEDTEGFTNWLRNAADEASTMKVHGRLKLTDHEDQGRVLIALLNTVYVFSKSGDRDLLERIRIIITMYRMLVEIWPASLLSVIGCLDRMAAELSVEISKHDLLPTLLDLRSI
jgi:hypothetical protein